MFKKQLIAVLVFGLLSAGLIAYSVVNVSGQSSSFENSGYVHVSAADNSNKRILFNSGTTYKKKVGDVISFNDSTGEQSKVDVNNFIHYDDSSVSSFVEGVLVDLDALSSNSAIDHYALAPNTVLSQSGSSYTILNSSENYTFKDVIWKISEDKYLLVSPSMKLRIGEEDERDISTYAEISYSGDSLIQIQTEDNIWQTISDDAHLLIDNGLDIDLSKKAIQSASSSETENNVLLDFSRIVIDGEDNVEISPLVGTRNGETIIPHFNITAEDGADGISGTAGNNGAAGGSGNSGTNGNQGDDGHDGDKGAAGDTIDGDIKDFPVFTLLNWTLNNNSCEGNIRVKEKIDEIKDDDGNPTGEFEASMLSFYNQATGMEGGSIRIQDLSTGAIINPTSVSGDAGKTLDAKFNDILNSEDETIHFTFNGLEPDHSYLLIVDALTSYDNGTTIYLRPYISKTFWTDSLGIYAEAAHSTETSIGFDVVGLAGSGITASSKVGYAVFDSYDKAAAATVSSLSGAISGNSAKTGSAFTKATGDVNYRSSNTYTTEGGLDINQNYYVRILYNIDGAGAWDGMTTQILEVPTLKSKAYIGTPILRENHNIFGFNVDPGIIRDEYSSFVNYSYEFYAYKTKKNADGSDMKDAAGNVVLDIDLTSGPLKAVTTKIHDTLSVSVGNELRRGVQYCVRTVATFYDNEKYYTLTSGFSNPAMLAQSVKPLMYFVGNSGASEGTSGEVLSGTYVTVDDYDSIHGRIVIQPGDGGAYLGLHQTGNSINSPTIVIKKDGYYYAQYPVYYSDEIVLHPAEDDAYMLATVDSDNVVTIHLNDPLDSLYTANSKVKTIGGTQPTVIGDDGNPVPSTYEITLMGDVVDGTTVQTNVQIGRCEITVGRATPILAAFTMPEDPDESKPLKNVALKLSAYPKTGLSTQEQNARNYNFEREKGSISTATSIDPVSGQPVETYTTEVPGTIRSITIDLFGKIVDEKFLEEVTTYLNEGEEGYDDASNPEHIKDKYEYPDNTTGLLASRTLYRSNPEDDAIINKLFSSRGYILTERFFFPDTVRYSDDAVTEIFASHPELTIYVKEAIDYAYGKAGEADSEKSYNGVQDKYSDKNEPGKTLDASTNKYFYANIFRAGNPTSNPNILLINKYDFNGTNRRACYITQTPTINPITDSVFEKFTYKTDSDGQTSSINAKASYDNMMKTLTSVTYYVYDAVDFYAGNNITVNGTSPVGGVNVATSYKYMAPYNNGSPKTYQANKDVTDWMNSSYPTKAGTYATPVHLDGLELAKITLNVSYASSEGDGDADVPGTPEVKFIPMTRAAYAQEHYAGNEGMIPRIDPSSSADNPVYLFFLGDRVKPDGSLDTSFTIDHFLDASKNAQLYESNGHQYVIAWTAQCTIQDTGEKLVYPFDSVVYASENYYTEAPYGDTSKYPYDLFATTLENNLMKECSAFTNISYVTENGNVKFGNDAYMLIPHSTMNQNNYCLDMEKLEPEAHAMLYEADSSSASSTLTVRATLYDFDKAVVRKNTDTSHADYKKAKYYRTDGSNYYTNNISGDLFVSNDEPYAKDINEMKDLFNKATGVSEIKVIKDNAVASNTTSAVVAVQRYNDKYTINGAGAHASATAGYVTGSSDNNWKIKNNSNTKALKKYLELFTTEFNGAEKENEEALKGYFTTQFDTNPIKGTFYWKANATNQVDKAVMAVEGPTDIMKRVAGFRIYFTEGGETFYVDKLLPTMDTPDAIEGGMEFFQFQKINEGNADETLRIRFNISLALEIIKIGVNPDKRIKSDAAQTIVTHTYPNFNGKKNIQISFDLLYPSTKSGYKYLWNTYNVESSKYYSDETFSLKQLSKGTAGDNQVITPITRRDYLALNTNYNSNLTYSTSAGYSSNELNTLGSFYYLRLRENSANQPSLGVESTRHWTTNNVNPMLATRSLTTKVNSSSVTSLPTMTQLIPVLTATINKEGTPLSIDSYEFPCLPFTDDPDVSAGLLRNGQMGADGLEDLPSTIDTPKANPYVGYSDGKSTVSSITSNIGYVEMENDEYVYFTLSQRVPNNFFDDGKTVKLYKLTGADGEYNTNWVPFTDVNEVNMTTPDRYTDATEPVFTDGGAYAGLEDYFMRVKMSEQQDPVSGNYSTLLKFTQLASNKQYSIICWRYVTTQDGKALIPAEMIDSNGLRVNNHCDINTKELPKPQPFTLTYTQPTDVTKKLMYENFKLSNLPGPDDEGYDDEYYTIIEIQDNAGATTGEENNFITYLSLIDTLTTETETFDADGVVNAAGDISSTKFIKKYNSRDELNGSGGLVVDANRLLSDDIKYGATYNVMFRTYKKGEGPAYMSSTELAAYDWTNDPLSIFVDRTTIDQDNYLNNTPTKTFTPGASLDSIGTIVPTTNLSTKAESYFTFIVGGLNSSSGSTRNMAVLPIAIWEHLGDDGHTTEYYDVTRFLQYTSDSSSGIGNDGNPHALEKGAVLRVDFATIKTDADGNEYSEQIFAKDEKIHVLLYSRQLGEPLNLTESSGTAQGCVLGEEALKNSKKPTTRANIQAKDYFTGRVDGFEPDYLADRSDPKLKSITQEQFAKLSTELYEPATSATAYNVGSRLLRKNFATTQDTDITVGKVTVTPVGKDIDSLTIRFDDHKLINEIDYMTYELIYHTKYEEEVEEDGAIHTVTKDHEYCYSGSRGVATKDLEFGEFADSKEGVSGYIGYSLNTSSFISSVRSQMGSGGRTNEEDCRLEVILQFFVESEGSDPDLPVSFSRASETKLYREQILIDDDDVTTEGEIFNKKLECNMYFSTEAKTKDTEEWTNPDTGLRGWYAPEEGLRYPPETDASPLMNLLNNLNNFAGDLLDNLFGGDNDGK